MKKLLTLGLFAALLLTSGCAASSTEEAATDLAPTDPNTPIAASAGNEFQIIITANPTTGYHWELIGELDADVVEFVSRDYQSTSEPGLVGGGGVDLWIFKAVGPGTTTIELGYYPPSNDPVEPEQRLTFTLDVK